MKHFKIYNVPGIKLKKPISDRTFCRALVEWTYFRHALTRKKANRKDVGENIQEKLQPRSTAFKRRKDDRKTMTQQTPHIKLPDARTKHCHRKATKVGSPLQMTENLPTSRCIYSSNGNLAQGYKTFFMLNSAEHEIFSANKYENANNSWHFHIY